MTKMEECSGEKQNVVWEDDWNGIAWQKAMLAGLSKL